jgi:hypothetical protein
VCEEKVWACSDSHVSGQSNELTEGMLMASGGGSVLARGEEATAFIAGRKAMGSAPLRTKAMPSW